MNENREMRALLTDTVEKLFQEALERPDREAAEAGGFPSTLWQAVEENGLTLALVPRMAPQIMQIKQRSRGINYGSNKLRFTGMVPAGSRVRMRQKLLSAEDVKDNGVRLITEVRIEREASRCRSCRRRHSLRRADRRQSADARRDPRTAARPRIPGHPLLPRTDS